MIAGQPFNQEIPYPTFMKYSLRNYLFWITLGLLTLLLFMQVRWIVYTINFQETVFEKSVALALDKSVALLNDDKHTCDLLRNCVTCDTTHLDEQLLSHGVWDMLQKSVKDELAIYGLELDFDLFITHNEVDTVGYTASVSNGPARYYSQNLREIMDVNGYELVLQTPFKGRFLPARIFSMFGASVILLLLAIVSIVQLVRLYRSELTLSGHTRELINNITHEFKTPISNIALAAGLIRKSNDLPESAKIESYVSIIVRENQKLKRQVEGLLDMAAVEWDEFEYRRSLVGMRKLTEQAIDAVRLQIETSHGSIELDDSSRLDAVFVDPSHMVNVIVNLLTNAINYSGDQPAVVVRISNRLQQVVVEVIDNGIGIPARYHRYLFDKYFRVPTGNVHNIKGFGIGLSYVKRVTEAHGGEVSVRSEPGKGSTFCIVLPMALNKPDSD